MPQRVLALLAVLMLAACTPEPGPPLRFAVSSWPGYEPAYLGRDLGYLDERKVVEIEVPNTDLAFEAFRNGSVDLAALSLNEYVETLRGGVRGRILAVIDRSVGADAALARPAVRGLADLKGKRVMMANYSFVGRILLGHMLDEAHLAPTDVQRVYIEEDHMAAAYQRGQGDVVLSFEPFKSQILAQGAHVIFDTRSIPNEIVDVIAVQESTWQERRAEVCDFTRQWFRTMDRVVADPADAMARMARRRHITAPQFATMMDGMELLSRAQSRAMLDGDAPPLLHTVETISQYMTRDGAWTEPVDAHIAVNPDVLTCYE